MIRTNFERCAPRDLLRIRFAVAVRAFREWLYFDSFVGRTFLALAGYVAGVSLLLVGQKYRGTEALSTIHRANFHAGLTRAIERLFQRAVNGSNDRLARAVREAIEEYPASRSPTPHTAKFFETPEKLLKGSALVIKSPGPNERGVLYLYYTYLYPLFLRFFDVEGLTKRYHIVVEPSWAGHCDLNILCLTTVKSPVFVGALEPHDTHFLSNLGASIEPVEIAGNTWIDHELFKPLPGIAKEYDLISIAAWSHYKRHWALFKALRTLKARGLRPKVLLVGYPVELKAQDIYDQACAYGVEDLLEFHEKITPKEVNEFLNRSKVNILWSRREGTPRAIIESMAAGVPCIVRKGFNYGYHYPYVNEQSGQFSDERSLPDTIEHLLKAHASMEPRPSVIPRMTPRESTRRLNNSIRAAATKLGEQWTRDIAVRGGNIDGLAYLDAEDRDRFQADYEALKLLLKR